MKRLKKGVFLILSMLMVFCMGSVAMAYDYTAKTLSQLQGKWYDENGNVALEFNGNYINGCQVVGVKMGAGGGSDYSCIIRIIEATGYRDLSLNCEHVGGGPAHRGYHSHVILKESASDWRKGTLLTWQPKAQFYESVHGIGLDTPEKEVLAKLGKPDKIGKPPYWEDLKEWRYTKLGFGLTMRYHRVLFINLYKKGNGHFDKSGLSCNNTLADFKNVYHFKRIPEVYKDGSFGGLFPVGGDESIMFDKYPDSISLTYFSN